MTRVVANIECSVTSWPYNAWIRGLDCIAVERADLSTFLDLKVFKAERVKWLLDDLKPWFPFSVAHNSTKASSSLRTIYLSRVSLKEHLPDGAMSMRERLKKMGPDGPRAEPFRISPAQKSVDETDIVRYLAVLDSGLVDPAPISTPPPKVAAKVVKKVK